jgi:prephenate dehydrogenase
MSSKKNSCSIGIIGLGRMGKLLSYYLSRHFPVFVYELPHKQAEQEIRAQNATPCSLEELCQKDVIIPAVPISEFSSIIQKIAPLIKPGAIVLDLCSVKAHPMAIMEKYLPAHVQILGTHPMFGPDSAAHSLKGAKIVLCRTQASRMSEENYQKINSYLTRRGLIIIETDANEHDRQSAETLVFTHFLGRSLMNFGIDDFAIDTAGYQRLQAILATVQNDSWQLFNDMIEYNAFAKDVVKRFLAAIKTTANKVGLDS